MAALTEPLHSERASRADFFAFVLAYLEFLNAYWEARERRLHPWQNGVSMPRLLDLGVRPDLLLWMLYQAHVDHLAPDADSENAVAGPWPWASARLGASSCFALNDGGARFADEFLAKVLSPVDAAESRQARGWLRLGDLVPRYDRSDRLFTWGQHVLKHFRQPSFNQEVVLCTAEELCWPAWFDDPLPRGQLRNPKVRLHDTIKDLNRRQGPHLVHFKGDGTGTRIGWELR